MYNQLISKVFRFHETILKGDLFVQVIEAVFGVERKENYQGKVIKPYPQTFKHFLRRYLDTPNTPETPKTQEVFIYIV